MTDETSWEALDRAEGITSKSTSATTAKAPGATKAKDNAASVPCNSWAAEGIAATLAKRSAVNAARHVLKKAFIFVEEQLRPMSYQWPASYGQPTSVYPGIVHGIPYKSFHFKEAPTVKRATVPVMGYDNE